MTELPTRTRILQAAAEVFATDGIRAGSMDRVAALAGITKRTLYHHLRSKDDLIAACLAELEAPVTAELRGWLEGGGSTEERVARLLHGMAAAARDPRWRGAAFLRAAIEMAELPGHPARRLALRHRAWLEQRLAQSLASEGHAAPGCTARALVLLVDGVMVQLLLHRDPGAVAGALDLARLLLRAPPAAALAA